MHVANRERLCLFVIPVKANICKKCMESLTIGSICIIVCEQRMLFFCSIPHEAKSSIVVHFKSKRANGWSKRLHPAAITFEADRRQVLSLQGEQFSRVYRLVTVRPGVGARGTSAKTGSSSRCVTSSLVRMRSSR